MLKWAVIFAAALLAAFMFGFDGVAVGGADVAKILFCTFLVMFVATLLIGLLDDKPFEGD